MSLALTITLNSLSRTFGLSPDQKSFLFKLMQSLLPTRDNLARLRKVIPSDCLYCEGTSDTPAHLLSCTMSNQVSSPLTRCIRTYFPNIPPEDIVILKIPTTESLDLPISWLLASCLGYIWQERVLDKQANLEVCRAELLGSLAVLKSTRWNHYSLHNSAELLKDMINLHFN